ncbi:MAG: hypothetical protein JRH18_03845 [Deltaproteobacteria bacterium]|nr:hypothetical protein [Deltaproteobacteria bacterium]MBW1961614.1 hypothetical protein [Deltaproteobacteria bacterium]MBW2150782.1 hypothetical protein [Deltaproteobacteria bacterium]
MRYKYKLEKNDKANELVLQEYGEVDEDRFELLNEATYDQQKIASSALKGETDLIKTLRTENMYPPSIFSKKLFEMTTELLNSENRKAIETLIDDLDYTDRGKRFRRRKEPIEEELLEIEDVLKECTDEICSLNDTEEKESDLIREMFPFDEVA